MDRLEQVRRNSIRNYIKANNYINDVKIYGYKFTKLGAYPSLYLKKLNNITGKLYFEFAGYLSNVFYPSGNYKGE